MMMSAPRWPENITEPASPRASMEQTITSSTVPVTVMNVQPGQNNTKKKAAHTLWGSLIVKGKGVSQGSQTIKSQHSE